MVELVFLLNITADTVSNNLLLSILLKNPLWKVQQNRLIILKMPLYNMNWELLYLCVLGKKNR